MFRESGLLYLLCIHGQKSRIAKIIGFCGFIRKETYNGGTHLMILYFSYQFMFPSYLLPYPIRSRTCSLRHSGKHREGLTFGIIAANANYECFFCLHISSTIYSTAEELVNKSIFLILREISHETNITLDSDIFNSLSYVVEY